MKIKQIALYFPMSAEGDMIFYKIGMKGITKIEGQNYNAEPYYAIYKGDKLVAEMYHYSLVEFFEEEANQ